LKRYVVMLAVMALLMVALAVPAFAQGKTEQGPDNANSECSYSGLNDFEEGPGPRTQSYGTIVSGLAKEGVNINAGEGRAVPGFACNGNLSPLQEGR
jgi:hypothetical protein